jgi:hypothetical protein
MGFLMKKILNIISLLLFISASLFAQDKYTLFRPSRVFDGETIHNNWQVLVKNQRIEAVGEKLIYPAPILRFCLD